MSLMKGWRGEGEGMLGERMKKGKRLEERRKEGRMARSKVKS